MPDHRYTASRQTIGSLLSTTSPRIEVPAWQRSYSWSAEQVEAFWQDLAAFDVRYPGENVMSEEYFLGSIVLVTGGETNLLLDGQQRLATATILLSALRDARYDFKRDAALRLQNRYISDYNDATGAATRVLTLNVYDREFFRALIQDEPTDPPTSVKPTLKSHDLIRKARDRFAERIAQKSEALGGGKAAFDWNVRVSGILCDHMSVVAVTSSDEDNAADVFETLNDRGIGLSTPDLLRNLLLRRAPDDETRERVVSCWLTILAMNEEASVDEFLRHYWVSQRGDVKVRSLYREIKATVNKEEIKSLEFSLALAEAAPVYRDIARARDDDAELQRNLEAIKSLGAKALYPALMSGYAVAGKDNLTKLREFSSALVTMFVRYNVIGGRETTVMETAIYKIASDLRKDKDFDSAIAALAALSPSGDEFVARFQRASIGRIAIARYLLREIEHAMRVTEEVSVEGTDRVHVEHIYPQTPLPGEKLDNHAGVVNRLGNLTLLGKRFNTSIKNSTFATKKEKGYESSDILMTKSLIGISVWDLSAIEERQRQLSEWVFDIWKFPGETLVAAPAAVPAAQPGVEDESALQETLPEVPA